MAQAIVISMLACMTHAVGLQHASTLGLIVGCARALVVKSGTGLRIRDMI